MARAVAIALVAAFVLGPAAKAQESSAPAKSAREYLAGALADQKRSQAVWIALAATKDPAVMPLLKALARSEDERGRRFAVAAIGQLATEDGWALLRERLAEDPSMPVRAEALGHLLEAEQVGADDLEAALQAKDPTIQLLAARGLVRLGHPSRGLATLEALAKSSDPVTGAMAGLTLLGLGYDEHREAMVKLLKNPRTNEGMISLLLGQIQQGKIKPAADLARLVIATRKEDALKVQAFHALAAVADVRPDLLALLGKDGDLVLRVNLLDLYADQRDVEAGLAKLAGGEDAVALLAGYELARLRREDFAAPAVAAVRTGHPMVMDYLLDAVEEEVKTEKALTPWEGVLLEMVRTAPDRGERMQPVHFRVAQAVTLLVDHGSTDAVGAVKKMLDSRYGPRKRAVAAGLLRAENKRAADLARALLKSPYHELSTDAALTLGKFGDPAAGPFFERILIRREQNPEPLVALAAWYTLKIAGREKQAAADLAEKIK
jgi:HEAT repeat protein